MRYEPATSPESTFSYIDERHPIDRGTSYPPPGSGHGTNGHTHHRTSNGGSSSHGHRPPPRLVKKTSFTSSTHPSSSRHYRKKSIDIDEDPLSPDDHTPHRSGSMSSEKSSGHVHHAHRSGHHVQHRHHSGRHENGHGHGHGNRRLSSPGVLDEQEEEGEDILEAPTRAHVDVHNAEQFWAGKLIQHRELRVWEAADFYTEIEAILIVPATPTLTQLDNTLRMFITFTAAYHGMYQLISPTWLIRAERDRHIPPFPGRDDARNRSAPPIRAVYVPRRPYGRYHDD